MSADSGFIEAVARAICKAAGAEPDDTVLAYKVPMIGAKGYAIVKTEHGMPTMQSWQLYTLEAVAAIDVILKRTVFAAAA